MEPLERGVETLHRTSDTRSPDTCECGKAVVGQLSFGWHEEYSVRIANLNTVRLPVLIFMSVNKSTTIEYKLCAECQYSVPRNELVDGKCVYFTSSLWEDDSVNAASEGQQQNCVHDIPNPMWK
jgi:hypothetical protein